MSFNGALTTIFTGSVGVAPGTSITGSYAIKTGALEQNSVKSIQCASDLIIAYGAASGATCEPRNLLPSSDLSGLTLYPGVYCSASGAFIISATTLTLDGRGDSNAEWIFQTATSLVTATATSFILQNGAQAKNIYWSIGSSATIGYSSSFQGTILAKVSISFGESSVIVGRGLALAAVSFAGGSSVTLPTFPSFPIVLSSASPSPSPSASSGLLPSASPSLSASTSPSLSPSASPSLSPSTSPSLSPSALPSASTTKVIAAASSFPSAVPTGRPTSKKEMITRSPTTEVITSLVVSQSIGFISVIQSKSPTFKLAVQTSAAQSADVAISQVSVTSISTFNTTRRHLLATAANVVYSINVPNGNFDLISTNLNNGVASGSMSNSLRSFGFTDATADTIITVQNTSPTYSPTNSPRKPLFTYASNDIIIGTTIGSIVFVSLMSIIACCVCCRGGNSRASTMRDEVHQPATESVIMANAVIADEKDLHDQSNADQRFSSIPPENCV